LLKVLENETQESLRLFHERALPDLGNNIKCGNSLIGPDFYEKQQLNLFDDDQQKKINDFDWQREFAAIFKQGGFDAVIGNPPYVRIQTMKETQSEVVPYFNSRYISASKGNYDIYVIFAEKGLSLLNKNGSLGFILPHKFFNSQYGQPLRNLLSRGKNLSQIVHFGHEQVFVDATTYTCLLFLESSPQKGLKFIKVTNLSDWSRSLKAAKSLIKNKELGEKEWNFAAGENSGLFRKLNIMPSKLSDVANVFVGLQTSADDVFILDFVKETSKTIKLRSKTLESEWDFEKDLFFPLVSGTDVNRYAHLLERQYILFPYNVKNKFELISLEEISKRCPKTAKYLLANKSVLENREKGKFKGRDWHRFGRNQNIGIQGEIKLCVPRLVEFLYASFDEKGSHFLDNVDVGGITLKTEYEKQGLKYLLGLLNSKVLKWYFPFVSAPFRGGWLSANRQFLSQLPIRPIDFKKAGEVKKHDKMVSLVEQMLELHKKLAGIKNPDEKTRIQRQIEATDAQIDKLVYELYDLTPEEIKIVEGRTHNA
jgi:hypothetical protein